MGGPGSGRRPQAKTLETRIEAARQDAQGIEVKDLAKPIDVPPRTVEQPTGSQITVQGDAEERFYNDQRGKYMAEFKFESSADLADLDALLMHELLDYRYTTQLASGKAYDGRVLVYGEEDQLRQNKLAEAKVIADLKRQLGIARASRDGSAGSVADYLKELQRRAGEFGAYRQEQVVMAISLAKELQSIVEAFDRSNDTEKRVVGIESEEDIVQWVREEFIPRMVEVEQKFIAAQRQWVGTL